MGKEGINGRGGGGEGERQREGEGEDANEYDCEERKKGREEKRVL